MVGSLSKYVLGYVFCKISDWGVTFSQKYTFDVCFSFIEFKGLVVPDLTDRTPILRPGTPDLN